MSGLAALVLSATGERADAQALTVLPVTITLAPGQRAASLTVINEGAAPTAIQIRAFAWDQTDSQETLTASPDLTTSPPIATLAPHAKQIVRLVLRAAPTRRESSYRILLDQIPSPVAPGTVRLALRLSIPVFALPPGPSAARLVVFIERGTAPGTAFLVARNDGTRHESLRDIKLTGADGKAIALVGGGPPYVLAGATRRWAVTLPATTRPGDRVRLKARGDMAAIDQQVIVKPRP